MKDNMDMFPPEHIEAQTDRDPGSLSTADTQLVADLYTHYQEYAQANAHSLAHVWQRLEQREGQRSHQLAQEQQKQLVPLPTSSLKDKDMYSTSTLTHKTKRWQHRLGMIAAVICLTFIVGSMIIVLNTAHHNKNTQSGHHGTGGISTPTPTIGSVTNLSSGVYISSEKDWTTYQISKLDAKTHEPVWTHDAAALGSFSVIDDSVYFNAADANSNVHDNYIYALKTSDGSQRWKTDLGSDVAPADPQYGGPFDLSFLTTPVVMDNAVYTLRRDGRIFALDLKDGHLLWTYDMHQSALVNGTIYDGCLNAANGIIYANLHNELVAINAQSKIQVWATTLAGAQIFTSTTIADTTVYISSYSVSEHNAGQTMTGSVYAFDAKNGVKRWTFPVNSWVLSTPTVLYGMVYFGSFNYNVYALRVSDGKPVWTYNTKGHVYDSPLVANGLLYIQQTGNLTIGGNSSTIKPALITLNASTGAFLWQKDAPTYAPTPQAVQGNVLYTNVFPRLLIAYDAATGKQLWQHQYGTKLIDKTGQESDSAPMVVVNP